jgi:hypothetical protein
MGSIDEERGLRLMDGSSPALFDALLSRTSRHLIKSLAGRWRKPVENEIYSAAAFFYRKFFVNNTPAQYCPEKVLLACFNLACKTEESHNVLLKDLVAEDFPLSPDEAVELELAIFESTSFEISIEQPWPTVLLFASRVHEKGNPEQAQVLFNMACDIIGGWQWTDAVLVFSFPQLAVAACLKASKEAGVHETVAEVMTECVGPVSDIEELVIRIQDVAHRHGRPEMAEVDEFARRCLTLREGEKIVKKPRRGSTTS